MLLAKKLPKGEDTDCPTAHREIVSDYATAQDPVGVLYSGLLPSLWTLWTLASAPIWGLLEEDGTLGLRAGNPQYRPLCLCACLGAPGHLLPPFSVKEWAGEAERAGNDPDWSDHAVPESCLACIGVKAGHCLRIIKTGMPAADSRPCTLQEILVCPWQYTKLTLPALPGQSLLPTQKYFNGFLLPATD